MEAKVKKILGFWIEEDVRLHNSKTESGIMGFKTRKDAEDFAIEFGLTFAKIHAIIEEN